MITKMLSVDPVRCDGCGDCEAACSKRHGDASNPSRTHIHIVNGDENSRFYLPVTCQHCEDPPCLAVCPNKAIYRDNELGRVMIRTNLCIGCKMCVSACPFGAMGFDANQGLAFKCDLCDGVPECVKACRTNALEYVEDHKLNHPRVAYSAEKHYRVIRSLVR